MLYAVFFIGNLLAVIPVPKGAVQADIGVQGILLMIAGLRRRHPHNAVEGPGEIMDTGKAALSPDFRKPVVGKAH